MNISPYLGSVAGVFLGSLVSIFYGIFDPALSLFLVAWVIFCTYSAQTYFERQNSGETPT